MNEIIDVIPEVKMSAVKLPLASIGYWFIMASYCLLLFSRPIALQYSHIEWLSGAGLIIGTILLLTNVLPKWVTNRRKRWSLIAMVYLCVVPSFIGFKKYTAISMAKDIIPLLFMLLVPLLVDSGKTIWKSAKWLLLSMILSIGIVRSFQFFLSNPQPMPYQELVLRYIYIWDPAVLFAAVFFLCIGFKQLMRGQWKSMLASLALVLPAKFLLHCIMAVSVRASFFLFVLSGGIFILLLIQHNPKQKVLNIVWMLSLFIFMFFGEARSFHGLLLKQIQHGSNGHITDAITVWCATIHSPLSVTTAEKIKTLFFGSGWGAEIYSPIFNVSWHAAGPMILFYLFKTGLIGLTAIGIIFIPYFRFPLKRLFSDTQFLIIALSASAAMAGPFVLGLIFKTLSFNIIFALLLSAFQENGPV